MADFFAKLLGIGEVDTEPMDAATRKTPGAIDADAFLSQIAVSDPKLFQGLYQLRQMPPSKPAAAAPKPTAGGPLDRIRALIQGASAKTPPGRAAGILNSASK